MAYRSTDDLFQDAGPTKTWFCIVSGFETMEELGEVRNVVRQQISVDTKKLRGEKGSNWCIIREADTEDGRKKRFKPDYDAFIDMILEGYVRDFDLERGDDIGKHKNRLGKELSSSDDLLDSERMNVVRKSFQDDNFRAILHLGLKLFRGPTIRAPTVIAGEVQRSGGIEYRATDLRVTFKDFCEYFFQHFLPEINRVMSGYDMAEDHRNIVRNLVRHLDLGARSVEREHLQELEGGDVDLRIPSYS